MDQGKIERLLDNKGLFHIMLYTRIIFVTRLSAIGDVIIATRALQLLALNGYYPILITAKSIQQIPEAMPYLNSYICFEKETGMQFYLKNKEVNKNEFKHFINSISVEKKSIFLDLQKTARSKRARKEIKNIVNFEKIYFASKRTIYRIFLIILAYLTFIQRKRSRNLEFKNLLSISNLQEEVIKKIILKDRKKFVELNNSFPVNLYLPQYKMQSDYICLFPGASGFIKMWPKENFRNFICLVLQNTQLSIVLCGSQAEIKIGEYLNFPKNIRVINLINKTTLQQTFSLIAQAKYIVTNDSFPAHVAHAFAVPATVLFGSTSPKFGFAPKADNIQIEYLNLACSPCTRHGKSQCRFKNLKCLREITAEKVFENMKTIVR